MIDIAGVVAGNRRDCLVVVALDRIGDTIRVLRVSGGEAAEITPAQRTAEDRCYQNYRGRNDRELVYPAGAIVRWWLLELAGNFHC